MEKYFRKWFEAKTNAAFVLFLFGLFNGEIVMACGAIANKVKSSLGLVELNKVLLLLLLPLLLLLMFFAFILLQFCFFLLGFYFYISLFYGAFYILGLLEKCVLNLK